MTGGPHPSARVAGGPARQRRARGEGADGPRGRGERGREEWAEPAQEGRGGEKNFF
jgi:hypothetical protein